MAGDRCVSLPTRWRPPTTSTSALHDLIQKTIREHRRILFNGNGYDDAWIKEAESRGLLNLKSTPDALEHMLDEKNVELFTSHRVLSETELRARHEIQLENYCKVLNIEALSNDSIWRATTSSPP